MVLRSTKPEAPYRWRCYYCGRWLKFAEAHYEWTPYGGPLDDEPPDEERCHVGCFERDGSMPKQWIGPTLHEAWQR